MLGHQYIFREERKRDRDRDKEREREKTREKMHLIQIQNHKASDIKG